LIDPSGMQPNFILPDFDPASCGKCAPYNQGFPPVRECMKKFCTALLHPMAYEKKIMPCIEQFERKSGHKFDRTCLIRFFISGYKIKCATDPIPLNNIRLGPLTVCKEQRVPCPNDSCRLYREANDCAETI